jgi:hypothetical protein
VPLVYQLTTSGSRRLRLFVVPTSQRSGVARDPRSGFTGYAPARMRTAGNVERFAPPAVMTTIETIDAHGAGKSVGTLRANGTSLFLHAYARSQGAVMPLQIDYRETPVCPACADDVGLPVQVTEKPGRTVVTFRCQSCAHTWDEERTPEAGQLPLPSRPK